VVRSCKASTWLGYRLVRPDLDMEPQDAMNHGIDLKSASKDCSSMPELTDQEHRSLNDQSTALLSLQGNQVHVHRGILPTLPTMIASGRHRTNARRRAWRSAGIRTHRLWPKDQHYNPSLDSHSKTPAIWPLTLELSRLIPRECCCYHTWTIKPMCRSKSASLACNS
jgi:hypothetical protein